MSQKIPDPTFPTGWRDFKIPVNRVLTLGVRMSDGRTATRVRGIIASSGSETVESRETIRGEGDDLTLMIEYAECHDASIVMLSAWWTGDGRPGGYVALPAPLAAESSSLAATVFGHPHDATSAPSFVVDETVDLSEFNYVY